MLSSLDEKEIDEFLKESIALEFFHGRDEPYKEMDGWGFNGPIFIIDSFAFTYDTFRMILKNHDEIDLTKFEDMVKVDGKYYGDFSIYPARDLIGDESRRMRIIRNTNNYRR